MVGQKTREEVGGHADSARNGLFYEGWRLRRADKTATGGGRGARDAA